MLAALDPEQQLVRNKYGPLFETALRDAVGQLSSRDRNLLRLHYVSGISLDAVARMYHVHRATVVRWLAAIRDEIEGNLGAPLAGSWHLADGPQPLETAPSDRRSTLASLVCSPSGSRQLHRLVGAIRCDIRGARNLVRLFASSAVISLRGDHGDEPSSQGGLLQRLAA